MKRLLLLAFLSFSFQAVCMEEDSQPRPRKKSVSRKAKNKLAGHGLYTDGNLTLRLKRQTLELQQMLQQNQEHLVAETTKRVQRAVSNPELPIGQKLLTNEDTLMRVQLAKEVAKKTLWGIISQRQDPELSNALLEFVEADNALQLEHLKNSVQPREKESNANIKSMIEDLMKMIMEQRQVEKDDDLDDLQAELTKMKMTLELIQTKGDNNPNSEAVQE